MSKKVFLSPIDTHLGRVLFRNFKQQQYDIYAGSLKEQSDFKPNAVQKWASLANRDALTAAILECDVIVYDIYHKLEEATFVIEMLSAQRLHEDKTFIALSSVMTWAGTPKKEAELDAEGNPGKIPPFTEEDRRKRRPHPVYREVLQAERLIARKNRPRLHTAVLTMGLLYGEGEDALHSYFKQAWELSPPALPIYGDGKNVVPMVHVRDVCKVVDMVIETPLQEPVVLLVEDAMRTQEEIVAAIAKELGTGETRKASVDELLLQSDAAAAQLTADIPLISTTLREGGELAGMAENWHCHNFVDGLSKVIAEYQADRGLSPLRVMVAGPPGVGKSTLAARLAQHYRIHHIHLRQVVERYRTMPPPPRAAPAEGEEAAGEEAPPKSLQEEVQEALASETGRLPDALLARAVKETLRSRPCQNQGFVIDGYPRTLQDCEALFSLPADSEDPAAPTEGGSVTGAPVAKADPLLLPEHVIVLSCPDAVIKERIMRLPEDATAGTHNTEEGITRRLARYHETNTVDNNLTMYFTQRDIHPLVIEANPAIPEAAFAEHILPAIGHPHNYGPTAEELAHAQQQRDAEEAAKRQAAEDELRRAEEKERMERERRGEEERARLEDIQRQEALILAERSRPLRKYLMEHVMPTLTKGLLEITKVRPTDPIDYLAEYLFSHTPDEDTEAKPFSK